MSQTKFAFPKQQKEPLNDAAHVRNAIARFNQVEDVTDTERDEAWKHIKSAAKKFGVDMTETNWRHLAHGGKS
jgi:cell division protein FtsX